MRLAAIYNVWADWDLLELSIKNIKPLVEGVIVIGSKTSNYGEVSEIPVKWKTEIYQMEPDLSMSPDVNERAKRNQGLNVAKFLGYTHFIMLDADEFYEPEHFLREKKRFLTENLTGLVCASQVYFKSPQLTIGLDTTLVTFIHKITPPLEFKFNRHYPYAFDKATIRNIRIDPTRQLNINSGVEWSDIIMHHYSWVRSDYDKKIRNSTARRNIERSAVLKDIAHGKEGYFCEFYKKTLVRSQVDFCIPEYHEKPIRTSI